MLATRIDAQSGPVLLLVSSHVGNNIFCTPAIHFLKRSFPSLTIDVAVTSPRGANAFRGNPDVSRIRRVLTKWQFRQIAKQYGTVLGMYRDQGLRWMTGLPNAHAIIEPDGALHRADQRLEFFRSLTGGVVLPSDRRYVLPWDEAHAAEAKRLVGNEDDSRILVGFHLGCGKTSVHGWKFWWPQRARDPKLWPLERYIELASLLKRSDQRIQLVITGSRSERFLAKKFRAAVPDAIDVMGKTTLPVLAALMSRLRVFITQDTGILHVACSTDVPLVALFGPTNLTATGPYPIKSSQTVIRQPTMREISAEEVSNAIVAEIESGVMAAGRAGPRSTSAMPLHGLPGLA